MSDKKDAAKGNPQMESTSERSPNNRSLSPLPYSLTVPPLLPPTATPQQMQEQQYEYSEVFRKLFATLDSEHRKLQELEQRRLKLTQEMQSLREMLQQENKRLRQSSPFDDTNGSSVVAPPPAPPPPPPPAPPAPPAVSTLNGPSTSLAAGLQKSQKVNSNFLRKMSTANNQMLSNWDNELDPHNQEEFNEIVARLPTLFNFIDTDADAAEPEAGSEQSRDALSLDPLMCLPPNPPPSESEFYDTDQSLPPDIENEHGAIDDLNDNEPSMGYGHLPLIHPLNPPHSSFYMPLTNLSSDLGQLDDMVPNLLNIPAAPAPPTATKDTWQMSMISKKK